MAGHARLRPAAGALLGRDPWQSHPLAAASIATRLALNCTRCKTQMNLLVCKSPYVRTGIRCTQVSTCEEARRRRARLSQSSTMTDVGLTTRISSLTSSALFRETCAVPTRKICCRQRGSQLDNGSSSEEERNIQAPTHESSKEPLLPLHHWSGS